MDFPHKFRIRIVRGEDRICSRTLWYSTVITTHHFIIKHFQVHEMLSFAFSPFVWMGHLFHSLIHETLLKYLFIPDTTLCSAPLHPMSITMLSLLVSQITEFWQNYWDTKLQRDMRWHYLCFQYQEIVKFLVERYKTNSLICAACIESSKTTQ